MAAFYTFEDLSGASVKGPTSENPYQDVIDACDDNPSNIQARYDTHRTKRNAQQREKLMAPDFPGVTTDGILAKLVADSTFEDPRHCLVFWARPTLRVRNLIEIVQKELLKVAPHLWIMPSQHLHMTSLEITHSLTASEIEVLVQQLSPHAQDIVDFTFRHRARVVKPLLSFDAQALALSYLPASGEPGRSKDDDRYTYHHLRRDLFSQATSADVKVASRYVIPSAHLTIGRFITTEDFETDGKTDTGKVSRLLAKIDEINAWLIDEFWPKGDDMTIKDGGEWIVGEEQGLDFRKGALWYGGGGTTVLRGRGS